MSLPNKVNACSMLTLIKNCYSLDIRWLISKRFWVLALLPMPGTSIHTTNDISHAVTKLVTRTHRQMAGVYALAMSVVCKL